MNIIAPRIVLDTNILIASIGTRSPFRWVFDGILNGDFLLCYSHDILLEYREILAQKTSDQVSENVTNFLVVSPNTSQIEIYFNFNLIRNDPSDNKFVDCAIAANAECLVSNDRHFQVLESIEFPKVNILTIAEFSEVYRHA